LTHLTSKVSLITGSARGIGKAIALRYASLGANVVINYSGDAANAEQTITEIKELGAQAIAIKADISNTDQLEHLFTETMAHFGRLDIVVANAGIEIVDQPVLEVTEEEFDRVFAVNTKGAFFTLQKAAKYVADNGRIIYVGSSTSCNPIPGVGLYGSSKVAARYLVGVLALEVGQRGITVNTILPTAIEGAGTYTAITSDHPLVQQMTAYRPIEGRMGRPEDVADAAEYFAGDLAHWVSGQQLLISGGAQQ
jgi:3-oxoacyl-[acyl-carrier protein] reductase